MGARDSAFSRRAVSLPDLDTHSVAARRAFTQQQGVDSPFRPALLRAIGHKGLESIELAALYRDEDDAEDWLHISVEELDRELADRHAEFEAYDKRHGQTKKSNVEPVPGRGSWEAAKENGGKTAEPEKLREELASMGSTISGMLGKDSSFDGMSAAPLGRGARGRAGPADRQRAENGDEDSESDDVSSEDNPGKFDVLGDEDESSESEEDGDEGLGATERDPLGGANERAARRDMHGYMTELDEQLDGQLGEDEGGGLAPSLDNFQLESRHVKVHGAEPLELDMLWSTFWHRIVLSISSLLAPRRFCSGSSG